MWYFCNFNCCSKNNSFEVDFDKGTGEGEGAGAAAAETSSPPSSTRIHSDGVNLMWVNGDRVWNFFNVMACSDIQWKVLMSGRGTKTGPSVPAL